MGHDQIGTTGRREQGSRRRSERTLLVFALASLAAHAAVIVALPNFFSSPGPAQVSVLEVTVLRPELLPVAAVPPKPTSPRQQAEPKNKETQVQLQAEREPSAPVAALLKPELVPEYPSTVAPSTISGSPPPAIDPKSQVAGATVAPPIVSSALLSNPAPRYPLVSRRSGEQGTVALRVLVTREGLPARVDVEKSSGSRYLDAAALEAVKGWRFTPARQGQNPIESWMLVPVVFRLEGTS